MGFFDNMRDRPITSETWEPYEIEGRIAEDALSVYFGCFLKGAGKVWVDDFELLTRSSSQEWEAIQIDNPGFERDREGRRPGRWSTLSPGYDFAVVAAGPERGGKCLLIEDSELTLSGRLFKEYPRAGYVAEKSLGAGLVCRIPLALYSDGDHTIGTDPGYPLSDLRSKLDRISREDHSALQEGVRIAGVVITWNVMQHFYPYFDVVDVDWDLKLTEALHGAIADRNETEFYYTLNRLIAGLQDGHARVWHKLTEEWRGLPFVVEWIEDRVVITRSKDTDRFVPGDVVLSVDGVDAEQALLHDEEYISASPQRRRRRALRQFGYGKEGTKASLVLERDGQILEIEAERAFEIRPIGPDGPKIEMVDDGIYYVNLTRAEMGEINERIHDLADARGVIFDLRGYPNGNHDVIRHLLDAPDTSMAWMRVPQIIHPDYENVVGFQDHGWGLMPMEPRIRAKVVFLTNARAISYAESFLGFVEHYQLAEIVGQPTAGTNGNVNRFMLPGGFSVTWTGMKVLKHDGSQLHLIGIQPTVPAGRTIQGVREGRDEVLETALGLIP
jgi:C-terminal processing protease CtpA/Prc